MMGAGMCVCGWVSRCCCVKFHEMRHLRTCWSFHMRNFLSLSLGHPALPRTLLAEREHTPGFGFSSVPSRSCRCKTLCPPILSHPAPSCRRQELRQKDSNDVKDKETHRCSSVVRRIQSPVLCNGWCPQTHRQRFSWSGVFFALCCKTIDSSTILHKHNRLKKEKKVSHRHRLIDCLMSVLFTVYP